MIKQFSGFIQIFNLSLCLGFCRTLAFKPSALECLTLLRITEEALTNVIKHSYAKKVIVRLYFSDLKKIFLELESFRVNHDESINIKELQAPLYLLHVCS